MKLYNFGKMAALVIAVVSFSGFSHAGTVNLNLGPTGTTGSLTGSSSNDNILMRTNSNGNIVFIARRDTVINFNGVEQLRVVLPSSVTHFAVAMGAGNDRFIVRDMTTLTRLSVFMGSGNDKLRFFHSSFAQGSVSGGRGTDLITGFIGALRLFGDFERKRISTELASN